ncbi:MAG: hypothetical protein WCR21_03905 [Bacteroidota bacterium]
MKFSANKIFFLILFFVLVIVCNNQLQAQCAMCKQAAETSLKSNPKSIARGLNTGILYLMAVPYLMIVFIFRKQLIMLWRNITRKLGKS